VTHLRIANFNTIDSIDLPLKDLLIFIGAQASGKSTISKAIYFFKSLRDDLSIYLQEECYIKGNFDTSISTFAQQAKQKFIKIYGPVNHFKNYSLYYDYGDTLSTGDRNYTHVKAVVFPSEQNSRYTTIHFSESFCDAFKFLVEKTRDFRQSIQSSPLDFSPQREITARKTREANFFAELNTEINHIFGDDRDLIFIPAGRSIITSLSLQRYNLDLDDYSLDDFSEGIKLDYLMKIFIERIDQIKPLFQQTIPELLEQRLNNGDFTHQARIQLMQTLIDAVLQGNYRYTNGRESLEFASGQYSQINLASSGQQEVLWILLFLFLLILNERKVFLVIEEPEAHLFPIAQKQMIDLVALLANQSDNQVIVTTHSPYILAAYNNLIYAHQLGHKNGQIQDSKVSDIVDPLLWLDSDRLGAYMLENGSIREIIDPENHLIHSAEIDRASDIIVDTFNRLFNLDDE
jgi:ABC-type cobalamin/Fe3+-siderophores transport system ATPase subunit